METDLDLPPIASAADLTDFFLCEENDSAGCNYVRGWIAFLDGKPISPAQSSALLFCLRHDGEVLGLFLQVSRSTMTPPTVIVSAVLRQLGQVYRQHRDGEEGDGK